MSEIPTSSALVAAPIQKLRILYCASSSCACFEPSVANFYVSGMTSLRRWIGASTCTRYGRDWAYVLTGPSKIKLDTIVIGFVLNCLMVTWITVGYLDHSINHSLYCIQLRIEWLEDRGQVNAAQQRGSKKHVTVKANHMIIASHILLDLQLQLYDFVHCLVSNLLATFCLINVLTASHSLIELLMWHLLLVACHSGGYTLSKC